MFVCTLMQKTRGQNFNSLGQSLTELNRIYFPPEEFLSSHRQPWKRDGNVFYEANFEFVPSFERIIWSSNLKFPKERSALGRWLGRRTNSSAGISIPTPIHDFVVLDGVKQRVATTTSSRTSGEAPCDPGGAKATPTAATCPRVPTPPQPNLWSISFAHVKRKRKEKNKQIPQRRSQQEVSSIVTATLLMDWRSTMAEERYVSRGGVASWLPGLRERVAGALHVLVLEAAPLAMRSNCFLGDNVRERESDCLCPKSI